ncbi:MAG TPA: sensor domain-containing diguanylate cyclase, partial [Terracidiphilus sp.]|nr:sensor domain-containing diguanylate cyclase [Terracidiphilus sp.]
MKATSRMFKLLLLSMFGLVGLSVAGTWQIDHSLLSHYPANRFDSDQSLRMREWIAVVQGLSLIACGSVFGLAVRLRDKAWAEDRQRRALELSLERRVEERTRELRQEVEERRHLEQLRHEQCRILELLASPDELSADEMLRSLIDGIASHNPSWSIAVHLHDRIGHALQLASCSEVSDQMKQYLETVGSGIVDSPECQASASGEMHITDQLSEIGLPWSDRLAANRICTVWSIPFSASGASWLAGTLTVYSLARTKPTSHELETAENAARLAALIVEHRRLRSELIHNAYIDALTGLPNRRAGVQAIETAIAAAAAHGRSVAVLWLDLNRFKRVNDQFGHEAGDHVLRTVAERLRRSPVNTGSIARMGEDEFMIVIPGTDDSLDTIEISRRLGATVAKP